VLAWRPVYDILVEPGERSFQADARLSRRGRSLVGSSALWLNPSEIRPSSRSGEVQFGERAQEAGNSGSTEHPETTSRFFPTPPADIAPRPGLADLISPAARGEWSPDLRSRDKSDGVGLEEAVNVVLGPSIPMFPAFCARSPTVLLPDLKKAYFRGLKATGAWTYERTATPAEARVRLEGRSQVRQECRNGPPVANTSDTGSVRCRSRLREV